MPSLGPPENPLHAPPSAKGDRGGLLRPFPLLISRSLAAVGFALVLVAGCSPRGCADPAPAAGDRATTGQRLEQAGARAEPLSGKVVRVRDGDSLAVLVGREQLEVRLDGVDAPELAQAFGRRAKSCAAELASGRRVRLDLRGKDKYGRELAEVLLPDGRSLNRELVSSGCAWWFRRHSNDRDLEARERQARAARRGLWADPNPVPPWDFRETRRGAPRVGR